MPFSNKKEPVNRKCWRASLCSSEKTVTPMKDNIFTPGVTTCHSEPRMLSGRKISQSKIGLHRLESVINRFNERSLSRDCGIGMTAYSLQGALRIS